MAVNDIHKRIYIVYFFVCVVGILIFGSVIKIQLFEGEKWRGKAVERINNLREVEAMRGNIYADDGSLIATSVPVYTVRMDLNTEGLTDQIFNENIDSLAYCLSKLYRDKSWTEYKSRLTKARKDTSRYYLINRKKINYSQLQKAKKFPIFRRGRYKGGVLFEKSSFRKKPFNLLAARTIGHHRKDGESVGIEDACDSLLAGISGQRWMRKVSGHLIPLAEENRKDPEDGADVHTTIDLDIQDVAENSLIQQLRKNKADHGSVVLMEVKTGFVKAIANLTLSNDGKYYEKYNYAVGESSEPGSTFKLATMMAALDDGLINPNDSIETGEGVIKWYDTEMHDSHPYGTITAQRCFEVSSNVGLSKIIHQGYANNQKAFADKLYSFGLNRKLDLDIRGEGSPLIKHPSTHQNWSGITITQMAIGYETQQTPLQTLAFYNAVANKGEFLKPQFVKEIRKQGSIVEKFEPIVLNKQICNKKTIDAAHNMLVGVVENGTGKNLQGAAFKIAGKTGTAKVANEKYKYSDGIYRCSFAGYFPADNPQYSCIVVINAPSEGGFYANQVALPVFKDIADKVYASSIRFHEELPQLEQIATIPSAKNGFQYDLWKSLKGLEIPNKTKSPDTEWVVALKEEKTLKLDNRKIHSVEEKKMPNVMGMGLRDAIYLLENRGLSVKITGAGKVVKQSITPGASIKNTKQVTIRLG